LSYDGSTHQVLGLAAIQHRARSAEFKQALKDNGVVLMTWQEIQQATDPTP